MILNAPMPYEEALDAAEIRTLLPTTGRTADLRQLGGAITRRAMFSATVTLASRLQAMADGVNAVLTGTGDQATAALALKQLLDREGYQPDPEKAGGLEDLSSLARRRLIIETNVATAQGYGWREQGMQPDVLDEYPAQELFRAFGPPDSSKRRNWAERWAEAGGRFYGDRMIALKTDPVWRRLGSMFDDSLGNDYPPFAFNSGMDVRDIGREEAEELGLIDPGTELFPQPLDLNAELKASPEVRDGWLRQAVEDTGLGRFDADGVFNFQPEGSA
ncbi:MAG TPA: hypothetical protein VGE76_16315 [Opitutaceae bacterium]